MTNLTINLPEDLKQQVIIKSNLEGVSLNFIINQAFQAYLNNEIQFGLIKNNDYEITASFDISTEKGKNECLNYFKSLPDA